MTGRLVPPHYVRPNETTKQPRRWVWLDTEAKEVPTARGWRQDWLIAVTAFDDRDKKHRTPKETEWQTHRDPLALWEWVSARTSKRARTILVAHNLAYDLRIAGAMVHLPALGWTLEGIRLDRGQAWARWRREGATLAMVDSMAWLPTGLAKIGDLLEHPKPPLPTEADDMATWEHRCREDVAIMREAMVRILEWLERSDLGVWQPTGAGMAWAAWRHRFMSHRVLVHFDPATKAAEREAGWTGRCEAWRWGTLPRGRWTEWDLEMAYCHVAADCEVPIRLQWHAGRITADKLRKVWAKQGVMARVEVTTDRPLVPAYIDGRICWPTGTFETTLWDPELRMLDDYGASWRPLEAWGYLKAPVLQEWARWVMQLARGDGDGTDPIVRMVAKLWTRALIGRFGLRYSRWTKAGEAPTTDVQLIPGTNLDTGDTYRLLQVGTALYWEDQPQDGENAVPSIMAWVMSEARRRLWVCMDLAGFENVAYVDTDSLIVNGAGSQRLAAALERGWALSLRPKGSWARIRVLGPRQLVLGDELRAAGVPKDATPMAGDRWQAQVWRSLAESIKRGDPTGVHVDKRTVRLRGTDRRRLHLAGGLTAPFTLPQE